MLNIVDLGARQNERCVAPFRNAKTVMKQFEERRLFRNGAPDSLSADLEFYQPFLRIFLSGHGIELKARPLRSSHRNRKVE